MVCVRALIFTLAMLAAMAAGAGPSQAGERYYDDGYRIGYGPSEYTVVRRGPPLYLPPQPPAYAPLPPAQYLKPQPEYAAPAPAPVAGQYGVPAVYGWVLVRPASCGQYRYWNGEGCADARVRPPDTGPRW